MSKMNVFLQKKGIKILAAVICVLLILAVALALLYPVLTRYIYVSKFGQEYYDHFYGLQVGDQLEFGAYEQDRDKTNGSEPIRWQVLSVEGNKALLISSYVLDCVPYSTTEGEITWEKSHVRNWLNGTFLQAAFTEQEKAVIPVMQSVPDRGTELGFDPGPITYDQVSLLSYAEANRYFTSNEARQCQATGYAKMKGIWAAVEDDRCWWWLRSAGSSLSNVAYVLISGYAYSGGCKAVDDTVGVRPVIWIEIPNS